MPIFRVKTSVRESTRARNEAFRLSKGSLPSRSLAPPVAWMWEPQTSTSSLSTLASTMGFLPLPQSPLACALMLAIMASVGNPFRAGMLSWNSRASWPMGQSRTAAVRSTEMIPSLCLSKLPFPSRFREDRLRFKLLIRASSSPGSRSGSSASASRWTGRRTRP